MYFPILRTKIKRNHEGHYGELIFRVRDVRTLKGDVSAVFYLLLMLVFCVLYL